MKRDLYNALMKGQQLLDEKGPTDWRSRVLKGLTLDPNFCDVTGWIRGTAWEDYNPIAINLGLLTEEEAGRYQENDQLTTNTFHTRLADHAFWPWDIIYPESHQRWTHEELWAAWHHLLTNERVELPE